MAGGEGRGKQQLGGAAVGSCAGCKLRPTVLVWLAPIPATAGSACVQSGCRPSCKISAAALEGPLFMPEPPAVCCCTCHGATSGYLLMPLLPPLAGTQPICPFRCLKKARQRSQPAP